MYVQWCVKGIAGSALGGIDDTQARDVIDGKWGIFCNWWRKQNIISPPEVRDKLTSANLDLHINNYATIAANTPFISLAAGCIERDVFYRTNRIHPAIRTALSFATDWGNGSGYLYFLWVIVGLTGAVPVQQVAEEVRNLNVYRSWSPYQLEGEVTAKVHIPSLQIQRVECWEPVARGRLRQRWVHPNPAFESPDLISNIRRAF